MTERHCTIQKPSIQPKSKSPRLLTIDEFIRRSVAVHGDAFDYSKSVYINCSTNIEIICKQCNRSFFQVPMNHWKGYRCTHCYGNARSNTGEFIRKAKEAHGNTYEYKKVKYSNTETKVKITCKVHGDFEQRPSDHINGKGCRLCAIESVKSKLSIDFNEFSRRSLDKHEGKYEYREDLYYGLNEKAGIVCDVHGLFYQNAKAHLHGKGCRQCGFRSSGFNRTRFKRVCEKNNGGNGWLYIVKCNKDSESFYKVGITSRPVSERFKTKQHMPYDYEIIYLIEDKPAYIFNLENRLHTLLKEHHYTPKVDFKGSIFECFNCIKPVNELMKRLSTTEQLQLLA